VGGADLLFLVFSQTPVFTLRDHGYGASVSRGAPVYVPAFAGNHSAYPRRDGQAELTWVLVQVMTVTVIIIETAETPGEEFRKLETKTFRLLEGRLKIKTYYIISEVQITQQIRKTFANFTSKHDSYCSTSYLSSSSFLILFYCYVFCHDSSASYTVWRVVCNEIIIFLKMQFAKKCVIIIINQKNIGPMQA